MSRQFLATLWVGLLVIGAVVYSTVKINKDHLLTLTGSITDVRVAELSPEATLVMLDFTARNPSGVAFEVKELVVERIGGAGGDILSKVEAARFLDYSKLAMPNLPLGIGDRIQGGETTKRLIAARFDAASAGFAAAEYRIRFRHIENVEAEIQGRKP